MASITFSGQLDQAMNEAAAEGNKILFIPQQTVGEVLPGAASELVVESDGSYSITLAYNTYSIYHYSDVTKKKTLIANSVVVSADTAVSTIPDLIGSTVPVTEDSVLTIQGYLTDAQESATAAATSESNAAASEAAVTNRVAAYEIESTEYLIDTFDSSNLETGDVVRTLGYSTAGDGGGAEWIKTGATGTASQSPTDTDSYNLYDSTGNEFNIITGSKVNYDGSSKWVGLGFGDYGSGLYSFNGSSFDYLTQRETQRDKFEQVRKEMHNGNSVSISAVGDSITWGSDGNNTGTQVDSPWPALLEGYLQDWFDSTLIDVVNHGYSGEDSSGILTSYIDDIVAEDSDLYLIAIGVNDARTDRDITPEQYYQNLMTIYEKLAGKAVAFVSLTPVYAQGAADGFCVDDYRRAMIKACNDLGCTYIDIFSEMQEALKNRVSARGKINRDRLHWSQEGYELIAAQIFMKGFCSQSIKCNTGGFIDASHHSIKGSDLTDASLSSQYTISKYISGEGATAKLFVYCDDFEINKLVAHVSVSVVTGSDQIRGVNVSNSATGFSQYYDLTITDAAEATSVDDYALPICDLKKGLNIIELSTVDGVSFYFQGFSIAGINKSIYMMTSTDNAVQSKYEERMLAKGYEARKSGMSVIANRLTIGSTGFKVGIVNGMVHLDGDVGRYRLRGNFSAGTYLCFGGCALRSTSDDDWSSLYSSPLKLWIGGGQTILYFSDTIDTNDSIASALVGSGDRVIDIETSSSGSSFYIDGTLVGSIPIMMPVFDLSILGPSVTGTYSIVEYVSLVGEDETVGGDIPGELFYEYQSASNQLVVIDSNGERRVQAMSLEE